MKKEFISESNHLLKEWDFERNAKAGIFPDKTTIGSSKKAWWICPKGHQYQSTIAKRKNRGCPFCSNRKIMIGYNDLKTHFPKIAMEWHPWRNGELKPEDVFPKSGKKVWWQCGKCGWEWQAHVYSRTGDGTKCPHCASNKTSFPEQIVYFFVCRYYPDAINRDYSFGFELDIYIPSIMVGIEYDGSLYHDIERDNKKDSQCVEKGVKLYRIRENGLQSTKLATNIVRSDNTEASLEMVIKKLLADLGISDLKDISIDKYRTDILERYFCAETDGNVGVLFPELKKEWHPIRNGNFTPDRCKAKSGRKVWWKCFKCGGEYRAIVAQRTKGHGCPFCSGHKALLGKTDLQTCSPTLASEWHFSKNGDLTPENVKPQTNKKVWWTCSECNNEWQATVSSRYNGNGCPYCAGQKVVSGKNDLYTKNPKLAKEWHPTKNGNLTPSDVMPSSRKKAWWVCPICDNEWQATIASRNSGKGCIKCGTKKIAIAKMRPVIQLTTNNQIVAKFNSIKEAMEATGAKSITSCCKHKINKSGGYRWEYADEFKE